MPNFTCKRWFLMEPGEPWTWKRWGCSGVIWYHLSHLSSHSSLGPSCSPQALRGPPFGGLRQLFPWLESTSLRPGSGLLLLFTQPLLGWHVISSGKPSLPNKCITLLLLVVILLLPFMYIIPFMVIGNYLIYANFFSLVSPANSMLLYWQSLEQCLELKSLDINFFLNK